MKMEEGKSLAIDRLLYLFRISMCKIRGFAIMKMFC